MQYNIIENLKEINFNKYVKIVSLGSNCFPKKLIDNFFGKSMTMLFDYIGISMCGILLLINNSSSSSSSSSIRVSDDFIKSSYEYIQTIKNGKYVVTNMKYYIRPIHDFDELDNLDKKSINDERMTIFKETYTRRLERFNEFLNKSKLKKKRILFIRFYENQIDRIMYPEIKDHYEHDEMYYLMRFRDLLTSEGYIFDILYFTKKSLMTNDNNTSNSTNDNSNNSIFIKYLPEDIIFTWDNCINYMDI